VPRRMRRWCGDSKRGLPSGSPSLYAKKKPGAGPGSSYALLGATTRLGVWPRRAALTAVGAPGSTPALTAERPKIRIAPWDASGSQVPLFLWIARKPEGPLAEALLVCPVHKKEGSLRPDRRSPSWKFRGYVCRDCVRRVHELGRVQRL
jgi:hypothetical protein